MHCVTKNFISLHQHSRICEGRCESLSLCGCGVFAILSYINVILSQTDRTIALLNAAHAHTWKNRHKQILYY